MATITELKCPICGHDVGEKEYATICNEFNKKVQETTGEEIERIRGIHEEELYNLQEVHRLKDKEQNERHRTELEDRVKNQVQLQLTEYRKKSDYDQTILIEKYEHEIKRKDDEIEQTKLQNNILVEKSIENALKYEKEGYRQKEKEFQLQISRIQNHNEDLVKKVEQLQKTLENVPSEFKGTAGENRLFEDLHKAFPQDEINQNIRGKEMPDVIQTIITDQGEKINTPILWDSKTGDNITPKDIEKAKRYKETYNTDYCILVSSKGITSIDSKNCISLIGKRNDILLVHPTIVVGIAEIIRSFIVEKTRVIKNGNGRNSKEIKLYDYITNPSRLRKLKEKMNNKLKLDEMQRLEENYIQEAWKQRKRLIQKWWDIDRNDQDNINDITQSNSIENIKEDNNDESQDRE